MRKICNIRTFKAGRFTVTVDAMEDDSLDLSLMKPAKLPRKLNPANMSHSASAPASYWTETK